MPGFDARPGRDLAPASLPTDRLFEVLRHPRDTHDFHLDDAEALALALFLGGPDAGVLRRLRARNAGVDTAAGRRIFVALNCAGCHAYEGIEARAVAPPLTAEGSRAREDWLRRYLLDPAAIRPYGPTLGAGGRMPDFGLNETDADSLVAFLMRGTTPLRAFQPATLSAFDRAKAGNLLETRFSCLGCHAWNGRGGRIAPDLGGSAERLQPGWIRAMLESPGHLAPGNTMPPVVAPAATLDLIASYVASSGNAASVDTARAGYLSLVDDPVPQAAAAADYVRHCAACHGEQGRGDGYNARFLRVRPADHTDSSTMALRPDDVLFDAIAAGGRFLDRSPEMPGFGAVLTPAAIRRIVAHIRTLCSCEGPSWSRDGVGR